MDGLIQNFWYWSGPRWLSDFMHLDLEFEGF